MEGTIGALGLGLAGLEFRFTWGAGGGRLEGRVAGAGERWGAPAALGRAGGLCQGVGRGQPGHCEVTGFDRQSR